MALRRAHNEDQQIGRFHQRHSSNGQDLRKNPAPCRDQFPLRSQEAEVEETGPRPHQGNHEKSQLQRHLPGRLHGGSRVT